MTGQDLANCSKLVQQILDALLLGSVLEPSSDEPLCGICRVRRAQDPEAEGMLDENAPLVGQILDALLLGSVLEPASDEPLCGIYRVRRAQDPEAEEMLEEH